MYETKREEVLKFKYQNLIEEFELVDCPGLNVAVIEIFAFRWCHSPINHSLNFLPNILYDRLRNRPPRILNNKEICGLCNLSFFTSEDAAREKYNLMKAGLEKKHKLLMDFYTHVASGKIEKIDGHATPIKNNHFGFYEFEETNFLTKFKVLSIQL